MDKNQVQDSGLTLNPMSWVGWLIGVVIGLVFLAFAGAIEGLYNLIKQIFVKPDASNDNEKKESTVKTGSDSISQVAAVIKTFNVGSNRVSTRYYPDKTEVVVQAGDGSGRTKLVLANEGRKVAEMELLARQAANGLITGEPVIAAEPEVESPPQAEIKPMEAAKPVVESPTAEPEQPTMVVQDKETPKPKPKKIKPPKVLLRKVGSFVSGAWEMKNPVSGKPFRSFCVRVHDPETDTTQECWGVDLERALKENPVKVGQRVQLCLMGSQQVAVPSDEPGAEGHLITKEKRIWKIEQL